MDNTPNERKQLGEVIATSYSSFKVESYSLNSTPPLGGLVVAENVIGVVCNAWTEGLGPISARGSEGDEDGGVYRLYPDLQRTLRTQFTALVVGCYDSSTQDSASVYTYPECPPRVHYKCWQASDAELVRFTAQPDYLRLLLSSTEPTNIDQVIIHLVMLGYRARGRDRAWLAATAEYLGRQLKGEYDRLLAILKTLDALSAGTEGDDNQSESGISDSVGRVRL